MYDYIIELELIENDQKLKTLWNQEDPIETVFYQIEECVEFAQHGNSPFTNTQILNAAYYIIAQSKIFKETFRDWKYKPATNKTWPYFKELFFRVYVE